MRRLHINRLTLSVLLISAALPIAFFALWKHYGGVEVHARIAEAGGWAPANLSVAVGEPLRLRLVSDDMLHGFAVGQSAAPALNLPAGRPVETTLIFDEPGKYVYYCTRWCGLGHWRMRGTIEVTGELSTTATPAEPPLYARLGIDIDEPVTVAPAELPGQTPSAARAPTLTLSDLDPDQTRSLSPVAVWRELRQDPALAQLSDTAVWDLVARLWQSQTDATTLAEGRALYAANCAACHGEQGDGDGIAARALLAREQAAQLTFGQGTLAPTDFTDPALMLGVTGARLQGKILRGGMGTGMPYWGPIFTEAQTWALVDFLWTFAFDYEPTVEQP